MAKGKTFHYNCGVFRVAVLCFIFQPILLQATCAQVFELYSMPSGLQALAPILSGKVGRRIESTQSPKLKEISQSIANLKVGIRIPLYAHDEVAGYFIRGSAEVTADNRLIISIGSFVKTDGQDHLQYGDAYGTSLNFVFPRLIFAIVEGISAHAEAFRSVRFEVLESVPRRLGTQLREWGFQEFKSSQRGESESPHPDYFLELQRMESANG